MNARAASLSLALLALAALSAVDIVIFRSIGERYRLESRNDGEQTMNALFASLRYHDDFGSAIESTPRLKSKVIGVGVYKSGARLYSWGTVPASFEAPAGVSFDDERRLREYLEKPDTDSLVLLLGAPPGSKPPPPPEEPPEAERQRGRDPSFLRNTMRDADVIYLEIGQKEYWRRRRLGSILFPASEIGLAALVLFVRHLLIRNAAYREVIEGQKNLVILGTAASTLAHEIKNPLLAIRLQTSILSRLCPDSARRELAIIDEEIERLSSLSHRVNDYLRDPAGNPSAVDPRETLREVGQRLCGRDLLAAPRDREGRRDGDARPSPAAGTARVIIDPERLRSILENLVRNALEAGGPEGEVSAEVSVEGGRIRIDVLDRGRGIPAADRERVFDPFFTTKSRGTGIGLAICDRFAQAAGGRVSLAGRPGGGTAARLDLPLAWGAEPARPGRPPLGSAPPGGAVTRS